MPALCPSPRAARLRARGWSAGPACLSCGGSALGSVGSVGSGRRVFCVPCALALGLRVPPAALRPPAPAPEGGAE